MNIIEKLVFVFGASVYWIIWISMIGLLRIEYSDHPDIDYIIAITTICVFIIVFYLTIALSKFLKQKK